MTGAKTRPTPVPRSFVQYPWNSWTYDQVAEVTSSARVATVTLKDIGDDLVMKLGLAGSPAELNYRIKVQAAQVWLTASGLAYPDLSVDFYEINGNTSNAASVRSTQNDKGTLNMPAKCGYRYPVMDQKDVLNSGADGLIILRAGAGGVATGMEISIRIQVLWQVRPDTSFVGFDEEEAGPIVSTEA